MRSRSSNMSADWRIYENPSKISVITNCRFPPVTTYSANLAGKLSLIQTLLIWYILHNLHKKICVHSHYARLIYRFSYSSCAYFRWAINIRRNDMCEKQMMPCIQYVICRISLQNENLQTLRCVRSGRSTRISSCVHWIASFWFHSRASIRAWLYVCNCMRIFLFTILIWILDW